MIAALKMSPREYYHEHSAESIQNLVAVAGFSKELENWIWEKKRTAFEVWK